MKMFKGILLLMVVICFIGIGCSDKKSGEPSEDPDFGKAGKPCFEDGTCDEGLVCANEICISASNIYFKDSDKDGFGDPEESQISIDGVPEGYVANDKDCDDTNAEINPDSKLDDNASGEDDTNCDGIYLWLPKEIIFDNKNGCIAKSEFNEEQMSYVSRVYCGDDNETVVASEDRQYDAKGNILVYKKHKDGDLDTPVTYSRKYTYDANGNMLTYEEHGDRNDPAAITYSEKYTYDANGNKLTYELHGDRNDQAAITYSLKYTYDANGNQLTYERHGDGDLGSSVTYSSKYTYDANGNKLTCERHGDGGLDTPVTSSEKYTYDANGNMLTYERHDDGGLNTPVTSLEKWTYDANGNKLTYERHENRNNLAAITYSKKYTYDANGNMLTYELYGDRNNPAAITYSNIYSEYIPIRYKSKLKTRDGKYLIGENILRAASSCYMDIKNDEIDLNISISQKVDGPSRSYQLNYDNSKYEINHNLQMNNIKLSALNEAYINQKSGPPPTNMKVIIYAQKAQGCEKVNLISYDVPAGFISTGGGKVVLHVNENAELSLATE